MTPALRGARLCLRPLAEADEVFWCAAYTDAALMRQVAAPLTPEAAQRTFRAAVRVNAGADPASAYWVVHAGAQAADIGLLGMTGGTAGEVEVGALILPGWQARGHAAEAIALLADHAFAQAAIQRLHTRHAGDNPGAAGLMRKLGFRLIAADDGAPLGHRWELLRAEWCRRHRAPG